MANHNGPVAAVAHHLVIADFGGKYATKYAARDGWERFKEDRPGDAAEHYLPLARTLVQVVGAALVQTALPDGANHE